jgi:hypothetical protein
MMSDARMIGRGGRHHKRALGANIDRKTASRFEFGGKLRPQGLACPTEGNEILFTGLCLRTHGQHPGGGVARSGPGRAAIEDGHASAALGQPPRH